MKGLYIHIPFCVGKCPYCDFYSLAYNCETAKKYTDAITDEIKNGNRTYEFLQKNDCEFDSVYFGGGTPSLLPPALLGEIINTVMSNYTVSSDCEITIECNPSSVSDEYFKSIKTFGVNRISIGMQSANDIERKKIGRRADKNQVLAAVNEAKNAGIDNISLDVMLGIPEQTMNSLNETVDFCIAADVQHISAYMLTVEKGTFFYKKRNELNLPSEEEVCNMYLQLSEKLRANGFEHYEISNFAKSGYESRHNLKYWNCEEYLGIGAAAHSFINGKRFFFERNITGFINGDKAVFDSFGGDEEEFTMLALRLNKGLVSSEFKRRFNKDIPQKYFKAAEKFKAGGYVRINENGFGLTEKGMLISNYIISEIIN